VWWLPRGMIEDGVDDDPAFVGKYDPRKEGLVTWGDRGGDPGWSHDIVAS
jgi:hypothetical protein